MACSLARTSNRQSIAPASRVEIRAGKLQSRRSRWSLSKPNSSVEPPMAAKSGKRRKSREMALQMLFQSDMGKQNEDHVRKTFWAERSTVDADTREFADDL